MLLSGPMADFISSTVKKDETLGTYFRKEGWGIPPIFVLWLLIATAKHCLKRRQLCSSFNIQHLHQCVTLSFPGPMAGSKIWEAK